MSRLGDAGHNLYTGQVSYDFVGRWRRWLLLSGVVILIGVIGLATRGLNFSIDFKGGVAFTMPASGHSLSEFSDVVTADGIVDPVVQKLGSDNVQVETKALTDDQVTTLSNDFTSKLGIPQDKISPEQVGASWGKQISDKAAESLIYFLVFLAIVGSFAFEWKMVAAAMIALVHDIIITVGIYALVGFEVSPSTVIGLLTILGYSLYDTVVVFDKVRENTKGLAGGSRMTYSGAANLAVNQTLVRSINTSVIALLPVASLLFVGAGLLGAGSLKDLALALFIGLATGTYSSIFIATPLLVIFKEREPQFKSLARRVAARQPGSGVRTPAVAGAAGAGAGSVATFADEAADPSSAGDPIADAVADPAPPTPIPAAGAGTAAATSPPAPGAGPRRTPPQRRPAGRPTGKKRRR
jgi:preprotein translocase subunit SecF